MASNEEKELAALLSDARKRPLNFAILSTSKGFVVRTDKIKSVDAMRKAAKAAGGGAKGAWGQLQADGRKLTLTCENEPQGGLAKQIQRHFASCGQSVQVIIAGVEDDDEEDAGKSHVEAVAPKPEKPATPVAAAPASGEEEDDEDDIAAAAGDLAALIKAARKRPYNFACLITSDGIALKAHRRKSPDILIRLAKADGGGPKGGWGQMGVEGKKVVFTCVEDPPQSLLRRTKLHLRAAGLRYGVTLRSPSGEVSEGEEDETAVKSAAPGQAAPDPAPQAPGAETLDAKVIVGTFRALVVATLNGPAPVDPKLSLKVSGISKLFGDTVRAGNLAKASKLVDLLRSLAPPPVAVDPRPEPGNPIWITGTSSGAQIATQNGYPVYARKRLKGDFGAQDEATAYARSLSTAAALLIEKGRYVIYAAEIDSTWLIGDSLDRDDLENSGTDDPNDTDLVRIHKDMVALISADDFVVRTDSGRGIIDRDGNALSPFEGQLATFGPGMNKITDSKQFEEQFELVMRDTAYAAVDAAETAARDVKARFATPVSAEDSATISAVFDALAPIRAAREAKEWELLNAKAKKYTGYLEMASEYINPLLIPMNRLRDFTIGAITGKEEPDASAEVVRLEAELAQLRAQESVAAADFPLALRIDDMDAFRKMTPDAQAKTLSGHADDMLENIADTRENIDDDDFDFWTMPGIRETAMASMGLEGDQLRWAQEKADWEGTKDTAAAVAEGVIGVGLAVAAGFATGGAAWVVLGASVAVGAYGAYDITESYLRNGSAANIALDPTQGLIPQEDVPHWGWVAASWIGLGLDASSVRSAIKVMKTADNLSDAAKLEEAAKILGVPLDKIDEILAPALAGRKGSSFKTAAMGKELFDTEFGAASAEAVTKISRNADGGFDVEIVVRMGGDPALRQAAVAEEMRHVQQLNDPAFADDFALLTEEALAGWINKVPMDKMKVARSQMRLEADSQEKLLADLAKKLQSETNPAQRAVLQAEFDDATEALGEYRRFADDLDEGIATGKVPATVDLDHPPRLFMRPQAGANLAKAKEELPGLKQALADLDNAEAYYFAKVNGKYQLRRYPEGSPKHVEDLPRKKLSFNSKTGKWSIEDTPDVSTATRRETVESLYGKPTSNASLEGAVGTLPTPFQQAYVRKFEKILARFESDGGKTTDILKNVVGDSDSAFEQALRAEMRLQIIAKIKTVTPSAARTQALTDYIALMPDNGSRGKLFSAFREAEMGHAFEKLGAAKNSTRLQGTQRSGDGVVGYTATPSKTGRAAKGPKQSGNFLTEDKSSVGAFDKDQLLRYTDAMGRNDGKIVTETGDTLDGIIYFFPDKASAKHVLDQIREFENIDNLHIGYLDGGTTTWLR